MSIELRRWMILVEAQKTYYIRLGDVPEGERSRIGAAPNHIAALYQTSDYETGVSVFDTQWNETLKRWAIINVGNGASLDELFAQRRPAYLVTGRRQRTTGIDGETLLRSLIIVKHLAYNELCVAGWGTDPLPEDYLEDEIMAESADPQRGGFDLKLFHGTDKIFDQFLPYSHFGTEAQARMRHPKRILPVYIRGRRFKRLRDTGDWQTSKLRAFERQGYDGVVYLNRYEGIPLAQFDAAHAKIPQERLDQAPDAQYKKMIPAAEDSYIIFDPRNVRLGS